jgi:hypothetical protein
VPLSLQLVVRAAASAYLGRRPTVPAESPTLGHLQFEALINTARLAHDFGDVNAHLPERYQVSYSPLPHGSWKAM